jgi:hypothetical protein
MQAATLDPVEFARGHLVGSAYLTSTSAREVHIQRLHSAFDRAGIANKLRFALRVLLLMREAEDLGHGYWFPTPMRAVENDVLTILVSASPTTELVRHFPSVRRTGYARVLSRVDSEGLPRQALDQWLGDVPRLTATWAQSEVDRARLAMGPTSPSGNVEYFCVEASGPLQSPTFAPRWTHEPARAIVLPDGIALCRQRLSVVASRYFVGQLDGKRLVAESNRVVDAGRLQFGMAALAGRKLSIGVTRLTEADIYFVPVQLPRPERRLLLALGQRDGRLPGRAYRVSSGAASSLLSARLESLGTNVRWDT